MPALANLSLTWLSVLFDNTWISDTVNLTDYGGTKTLNHENSCAYEMFPVCTDITIELGVDTGLLYEHVFNEHI